MKRTQAGLIIGMMGMSAATLALPSFVKDFGSTYGIKKESALGKATCTVCHIGKSPKLNPYGLDLKKAMQEEKTKVLTGSVLKKVEGLDSDKDGVNNRAEITADTLPGDTKSVKK